MSRVGSVVYPMRAEARNYLTSVVSVLALVAPFRIYR